MDGWKQPPSRDKLPSSFPFYTRNPNRVKITPDRFSTTHGQKIFFATTYPRAQGGIVTLKVSVPTPEKHLSKRRVLFGTKKKRKLHRFAETPTPEHQRRERKGREGRKGGRNDRDSFFFSFFFSSNDTTQEKKDISGGRRRRRRRGANPRIVEEKPMPGLPFPSRVHSPLDVSARVTVTKRRTVSALSGSLHRPPFRPFPPHPALRPATRGPYPLPAPRRDAIQPAAYCVFARRHIAARCYTRNGPLVGETARWWGINAECVVGRQGAVVGIAAGRGSQTPPRSFNHLLATETIFSARLA